MMMQVSMQPDPPSSRAGRAVPARTRGGGALVPGQGAVREATDGGCALITSCPRCHWTTSGLARMPSGGGRRRARCDDRQPVGQEMAGCRGTGRLPHTAIVNVGIIAIDDYFEVMAKVLPAAAHTPQQVIAAHGHTKSDPRPPASWNRQAGVDAGRFPSLQPDAFRPGILRALQLPNAVVRGHLVLRSVRRTGAGPAPARLYRGCSASTLPQRSS
jgi:hypothetical protein